MFLQGIFPPWTRKVQPTILDPSVVGDEHHCRGPGSHPDPAALQGPSATIAILVRRVVGEDKQLVNRARRIERFLSQNMMAAEQFTASRVRPSR